MGRDYHSIKTGVSIIDYAESLGFTLKKVGNKYYTLKEHDSVRIDPVKNCFWRNSTGNAGSIIDFAMHFTGKSFPEVIAELYKMTTGNDKTVTQDVADQKVTCSKKVSLQLPARNTNMRNVFAYLNKTRCIHKNVIEMMIHNRMLYQDKNRNCVFVSYKDDKAVFACKRGTNTYKPFYGDVEGCDYSYLFFIDNSSDVLIVTESVIDAASIMSMHILAGTNYKAYNHLSLAGCRKFEDALTFHIKNRQYKKIILCLDNDGGGRGAVKDIVTLLNTLRFAGEIKISFPSQGNDMNDQLKIMMRREMNK